MAKTYKIPVEYKVWGIMEIEADSEDEAIEMAMTSAPLPPYPEYVEDSIVIDTEALKDHN